MPEGHNTAECLYAAQEAIRNADIDRASDEIVWALEAFGRYEERVGDISNKLSESQKKLTDWINPERHGTDQQAFTTKIELNEDTRISTIRDALGGLNPNYVNYRVHSDLTVTVTITEPSRLGAAPPGTHEFARGWLMGEAYRQVTAELQPFAKEPIVWEVWDYSAQYNRFLRNKGTLPAEAAVAA